MLTEILPHLVQRPEDFLENVQRKIDLYRDTVLHPLEVRTKYILDLAGTGGDLPFMMFPGTPGAELGEDIWGCSARGKARKKSPFSVEIYCRF